VRWPNSGFLDFDAHFWSPPPGLAVGTDVDITLVAEKMPGTGPKATVTLPDGSKHEVTTPGCA